jgi:hypothetical protein
VVVVVVVRAAIQLYIPLLVLGACVGTLAIELNSYSISISAIGQSRSQSNLFFYVTFRKVIKQMRTNGSLCYTEVSLKVPSGLRLLSLSTCETEGRVLKKLSEEFQELPDIGERLKKTH